MWFLAKISVYISVILLESPKIFSKQKTPFGGSDVIIRRFWKELAILSVCVWAQPISCDSFATACSNLSRLIWRWWSIQLITSRCPDWRASVEHVRADEASGRKARSQLADRISTSCRMYNRGANTDATLTWIQINRIMRIFYFIFLLIQAI